METIAGTRWNDEHLYPAFRSARLWGQADLQTLRGGMRARLGIDARGLAKLSAGSQRLSFPMDDGTGDVLLGTHDVPVGGAARRPLTLLIHGLPGSQESPVVLRSAVELLRSGHPVLRLNLRGAGPSQGQTRQIYHAGRSEDLRRVLAQLPAPLASDGVVLIAYSLGGNLMLKTLGEDGLDARVRGAVSISAVLDLAETAKHLLGLPGLRRLLYVGVLLRQTKRQVKQLKALDPEQVRAIDRARSFYEFDDGFLAPANGFTGADDYYTRASSRRFLADIRVPTLLIHAPNDPIVPIDAYRRVAWDSNPQLLPLLSAPGGHAGFHARDASVPWHDRVIHAFLERL